LDGSHGEDYSRKVIMKAKFYIPLLISTETGLYSQGERLMERRILKMPIRRPREEIEFPSEAFYRLIQASIKNLTSQEEGR
jgi:hypothetical protein